MVSISGTSIQMTRGDTLRVHLILKDKNGDVYAPNEGDSIRFAMKADYNDEAPIILKPIPNDTLMLVLEPEDTKNLPQPSKYVYDIEITFSDGDVYTFINKAKLTLTEEVH